MMKYFSLKGFSVLNETKNVQNFIWDQVMKKILVLVNVKYYGINENSCHRKLYYKPPT